MESLEGEGIGTIDSMELENEKAILNSVLHKTEMIEEADMTEEEDGEVKVDCYTANDSIPFLSLNLG